MGRRYRARVSIGGTSETVEGTFGDYTMPWHARRLLEAQYGRGTVHDVTLVEDSAASRTLRGEGSSGASATAGDAGLLTLFLFVARYLPVLGLYAAVLYASYRPIRA